MMTKVIGSVSDNVDFEQGDKNYERIVKMQEKLLFGFFFSPSVSFSFLFYLVSLTGTLTIVEPIFDNVLRKSKLVTLIYFFDNSVKKFSAFFSP